MGCSFYGYKNGETGKLFAPLDSDGIKFTIKIYRKHMRI